MGFLLVIIKLIYNLEVVLKSVKMHQLLMKLKENKTNPSDLRNLLVKL